MFAGEKTQKAEKAPEKKASPLPAVLSAIAIIAIVIVVYHVMATGNVSQPSLSTKDPADVVLKLSDLPPGWSVAMLIYNPPAQYSFPAYTGPLPEIVYYASFSNGSASLTNEAMRFLSVNDANSYFDSFSSYEISRLGAGVTHTKIGDESTVIIAGEGIAGFFRKSNFVVVNVSAEGASTLSEFIDYLQTCEGRV